MPIGAITVLKILKPMFFMIIPIMAIFASAAYCRLNNRQSDSTQADQNRPDNMSFKINIKIGANTFTATIPSGVASDEFKAMLPMTLDMLELNRNEKYAALPAQLPTDAANPGNIQAGDLMLYGASTLVLFYESFSTPYSYTKLGQIDHTTGLKQAVGKGDVSVSFELGQ